MNEDYSNEEVRLENASRQRTVASHAYSVHKTVLVKFPRHRVSLHMNKTEHL